MKNIFLRITLWTIIVVAIITGWLLIPTTFWQYLFFLRIPILMGLFLILLPTIAKFLLPAVLKNLFVLRGIWQLAFTILGAIVAAMCIILVAYTTTHNAPSRFDVPILLEITNTLWQYLFAAILALPIIIAATDLSQEELGEKRWFGFIGGILFSALFFGAFDIVRDWLITHISVDHWLVKAIRFLSKNAPDGYLNDFGDLDIDHINTFAFFLVLLAVYLANFFIFRPRPIHEYREASALFYVTLLVSISTLFLGSLTFYFDYYRVSVLFFWLLISALMYWFFKVDHYFELKEDHLKNKSTNLRLQDFTAVLSKRLEHQSTNEKTLVVVCASGGGIQASGWTAQVLTGLQTELGTSFTKAISLISAASGGSVGSMYYLDRFSSKGYPENEELENIFVSATQDSLDATGWGLCYPDLWRVIALPLFPSIFAKRLGDRGIALETDWQGELKGWENKNHPKVRKSLATWREQIINGEIPIPVFNTTVVEDGNRCLVTPLNFGDASGKKCFNNLYGDYDIDIVTAARLSATFPYVSPICRNSRNLKQNFHMADGGYFDNSGFVTAVEWLNDLLEKPQNKKLKRVLILQINPFPQPSESENDKEYGGWFMTTIGPLLTLFKVRDPILTTRNKTEIEMLQKLYPKEKVDIRYYSIYFPSRTEAPKFYSEEGEYQPPLSWKLTKAEKEAINKGWTAIKSKEQIQDLKNLWHSTWGMS
ncbi:patatin-like phospholipase family protein [Acaryochloris sp. IP29b_bin.137]|uniref:patatin-like phospholipase family protein n=1 Tax=Acaryochloris sp. IP29b_bin.137 TaxID=2969217 RepID=UPI002619079A|nr:patatin-like phospholipase family protein [Acaryochloris sp. IP29b_bin.137]